MKKLLLLILFISAISFAQKTDLISEKAIINENFWCESKLIAVSNSDSTVKYTKEIKEISRGNIKDTTTVFDKNSKWKLLYLQNSGWRENSPGKRFNIDNLYVGKPNNEVLGSEIIDLFSKFNQKILVRNNFPIPLLFLSREAPLNGKFILIILENNLMTLQYIHSYPNGNQSSWYSVTNYYFKKIA